MNLPDLLVVSVMWMASKEKHVVSVYDMLLFSFLVDFSYCFLLLFHLSLSEKEKPNKGGGSAVEVKDQFIGSKQQKPKASTKAERRALQEAQRAAKAAAKGVLSCSCLIRIVSLSVCGSKLS